MWGCDPALCQCRGGGCGGLRHIFEDARVFAVRGEQAAAAAAKIAFDVGIVEPNSINHSARSGCYQSSLNVNAGTRDEEREKGKRYKVLCNQRGLACISVASKHGSLAFVGPIIFTPCGGMGEAFQRQIWHPHWKRVEA